MNDEGGTPPAAFPPESASVPAPGSGAEVVFQIPQGLPNIAGIPIGGVFQHQQVQLWQSQYPAPEAVERYEAVHNGAFGRMITMAERGQEAQIESTRQAMNYAQADSSRGNWLGFGLSVGALVAAVVCAAIHEPWVAGACVGIPVLAVARALIAAGKQQPQPKPQVPGSPPAAG